MAKRAIDDAGGEKHRRLGEGVGDDLHHPAAPGVGTPRVRARREREDEEQIADLRQRRIGDQQLEPRLPQRHQAAEQRPGRAESAQHRHRRGHLKLRQREEPDPQHDEERPLHHEAGENGAGGRRRVGVRGRQPQMHRKQRRLGEQPRRHQAGGEPDGGRERLVLSDQRNVERAERSVHQPDAEQVEGRAEQRENEVAQGRRQRLRPPVEADERHGGEGQKLQPDIEVEEIAAQEQEVEPRRDRLQQDPEGIRRARLGLARQEPRNRSARRGPRRAG